jgi:hypothetical protein
LLTVDCELCPDVDERDGESAPFARLRRAYNAQKHQNEQLRRQLVDMQTYIANRDARQHEESHQRIEALLVRLVEQLEGNHHGTA